MKRLQLLFLLSLLGLGCRDFQAAYEDCVARGV